MINPNERAVDDLLGTPADAGAGMNRDVEVEFVTRYAIPHEELRARARFVLTRCYVASCGHDATARIWEADTGREVARIVDGGWIGSVAFSPDGTLLATGGSEGVRLSLWRAEDLLAEACRRVTRNLTLEEWRHYLPDDEFRKSCPNR